MRKRCRLDAASMAEVFHVGLKDGAEYRDFFRLCGALQGMGGSGSAARLCFPREKQILGIEDIGMISPRLLWDGFPGKVRLSHGRSGCAAPRDSSQHLDSVLMDPTGKFLLDSHHGGKFHPSPSQIPECRQFPSLCLLPFRPFPGKEFPLPPQSQNEQFIQGILPFPKGTPILLPFPRFPPCSLFRGKPRSCRSRESPCGAGIWVTALPSDRDQGSRD